MAIEIKNFNSSIGLVFPRAYLRIVEISYLPLNKQLSFRAEVFSSSDENEIPLERDSIAVTFYPFEYDNELSLIDYLEDLLSSKIEEVKDKTLEECQEHNNMIITSVDSFTEDDWLSIWEYSFKRYASIDDIPSEDTDYIEAAKILLGEE